MHISQVEGTTLWPQTGCLPQLPIWFQLSLSRPSVPSLAVRCDPHLTVLQGRGERSYDIFSRLLRERVIMLYGPVNLSMVTMRHAFTKF
jgi:hypothetical protein